MEFTSTLFNAACRLTLSAVSKKVAFELEPFFTRRRVERKIEDSIAQVVEKLVPFFETEKIPDADRILIIETCRTELEKIINEPQLIFSVSLDGQKLFDRFYSENGLPEAISQTYPDIYARIFPQIANLICTYPQAVEAWKVENYREGFRRFDEIAITLGSVAEKLDTLASKDIGEAGQLLTRIRQSLAQRVEFQLDLTGLRGDRPDAVPIEKLFIVPEIGRHTEERIDHRHTKIVLATAEEIKKSFSPPNRSIVIGAPGAGKSTISLWLQKTLLTAPIPHAAILVRFRELAQREDFPSYQSLVREAAGTHLKEEVTAAHVQRWCDGGQVTLILDGFDEIPRDQRDKALQWLRDLNVALPKVSLILTSRPLTTAHLDSLSDWQRYGLLPFDLSRIIEYVEKWYANAPVLNDKPRNVDAANLAAAWLDDPVLAPLAESPLMLATLLMVHHMDGALPNGRAQVYERYIEGMLGLWDSRWGVPATLSLPTALKRTILTRIAVYYHTSDIDELAESELIKFLKIILPDLGCDHNPALVLDYLRERTGLLVGPGSWSFVHKSVAEFLVAAAIRDGDMIDISDERLDRLRLFRERHNDRWNTILFFWAGLATPRDLQSFISELVSLNSPDEFPLAMGLIHDQLLPHRLSISWRAQALIKLYNIGYNMDHSRSIGYATSFGSIKADLKFVPIRSLNSGQVSFSHNVINQCIRESKLKWQDLKGSHSLLAFPIWIRIVSDATNEEDLAYALANHPCEENIEPPAIALCWWVSCYGENSGSSINLNRFLSLFLDTFPDLRGIVILPLLVAIVENELDVAVLDEILDAVSGADFSAIKTSLLRDTFEIFNHNSSDYYDLLEKAQAVLYSAENVSSNKIALKRCKDTITSLRRNREALEDGRAIASKLADVDRR